MKLMPFLKRCLIFTIAWALLALGQFKQWPIVVVAVTAASASSLLLLPEGGLPGKFMGLIRFFPYFLRRSVSGGWDVARRVFSPSLPLQADVIRHDLNLKKEYSRVFFCWIISLLPGTACVGLSGKEVRVHVLDTSGPVHEEFQELERRLAAVFGENCENL
jgi:multicomponent Na+:H+ antiporter subunit E